MKVTVSRKCLCKNERFSDRQIDVAKLIGIFLNLYGEDDKREFNVWKKLNGTKIMGAFVNRQA
jgi:hypothetical protein